MYKLFAASALVAALSSSANAEVPRYSINYAGSIASLDLHDIVSESHSYLPEVSGQSGTYKVGEKFTGVLTIDPENWQWSSLPIGAGTLTGSIGTLPFTGELTTYDVARSSNGITAIQMYGYLLPENASNGFTAYVSFQVKSTDWVTSEDLLGQEWTYGDFVLRDFGFSQNHFMHMGVNIDTVQVTSPVPEPASYAMLLLGMGLLANRRFRAKQ